uniref:glycoside hydrolase family 3 C-terminal domain-containing protein n=1 Tax=Candidatus Fimivicinus sp. TaxID=3056640 RepID=UPI003FEE1E8C
MPFSGGANDRKLAQAVRDGKISEEFLDQMVDRLIDLAKKSEKVLGNDTYDAAAHHALAREIAGQCMVLLKNEGGLLPLKKKQRVAVIGEMAKGRAIRARAALRSIPPSSTVRMTRCCRRA